MESVDVFFSAVNIVLSIFTSAVGFLVMPGIDRIHYEVAEAQHSLQASCGA